MARGTLSLVFCGLMLLQAALALAASSEKQRVSSVSVEGVVFCDQCLQQKITKSSNLLKGAKVAIVCEGMRNGGEKASMEATTDGEGRFQTDLATKLFDEEGNIKCSATLHSSPDASCTLPSRTASATHFSRSSAAPNSHMTYRVNDLSFHPAAASPMCAQASYYDKPAPEYKPPLEKPPVYIPPVFKPPFEKPPMEKPPVYKPPVYKPPVYKPPFEKPPVYKPPFEKPPMEKPPVYKPPVYKPPVEKPPVEKPPVYYKPPVEEPKFEFPKFQFPKFKFPKFDFPKDKYPKYPPHP